jgi:hypothetical protein
VSLIMAERISLRNTSIILPEMWESMKQMGLYCMKISVVAHWTFPHQNC